MYKRYEGNSGRVLRVEDAPPPRTPPGPGPPVRPPAPARRRPEGLGRLLSGLLPGEREPPETEDLLLALILYLMYRESGDSDFLIMLGAMLLG